MNKTFHNWVNRLIAQGAVKIEMWSEDQFLADYQLTRDQSKMSDILDLIEEDCQSRAEAEGGEIKIKFDCVDDNGVIQSNSRVFRGKQLERSELLDKSLSCITKAMGSLANSCVQINKSLQSQLELQNRHIEKISANNFETIGLVQNLLNEQSDRRIKEAESVASISNRKALTDKVTKLLPAIAGKFMGEQSVNPALIELFQSLDDKQRKAIFSTLNQEQQVLLFSVMPKDEPA